MGYLGPTRTGRNVGFFKNPTLRLRDKDNELIPKSGNDFGINSIATQEAAFLSSGIRIRSLA